MTRDMQKEAVEVYKAHEKLGFPELDEEEQCKILVTGNVNSIKSLIPEIKDKAFPMRLINDYITIDHNRLKKYLINTNFIENNIKRYNGNPHSDGVWIKKQPDSSFEIHHQERGSSYHIDKAKNKLELIEYFSKHFGGHRIK